MTTAMLSTLQQCFVVCWIACVKDFVVTIVVTTDFVVTIVFTVVTDLLSPYLHHSYLDALQQRQEELLTLWQTALSPEAAQQLDMKRYLTASLVCPACCCAKNLDNRRN